MNQSRGAPSGAVLYMMGLLIMVVTATVVSKMPDAVPDINIPQPITKAQPDQLQEVMPWPDFVAEAAIAANGDSPSQVFFSPEEMPPVPNCDDLDIKACHWDVRLHTEHDTMVEVQLKSTEGKVMGRAQLLRVRVSEFPELNPLTRLGYKDTWIGHIEVMAKLRGNGLGRLMWKAGDAGLKIVSGGNVVRSFVDSGVGWGQAIMKYVPQANFILKEAPVWAYWIE